VAQGPEYCKKKKKKKKKERNSIQDLLNVAVALLLTANCAEHLCPAL
jgi:hypothetical protein